MNNDEVSDKLPIKQFSLDDMVINPSIVMIAKRGSGKSWIAKAILQKLSDIPVGIVISPTEKDSPFFISIFPDTFIFYEYRSDLIKKLLTRQRLILKKMREKEEKGYTLDPRAFIIMDDCLASKGAWANDPCMTELLFNGRHRRITYILTMQSPLGIKPELRTNFDYVFLLADDINSNLKKIYDHYAGMFPDFNIFRQVFKQLTEDFGAMVIINRGARKTIVDKIAYYRAPDLSKTDTCFGCSQFRTFHEKNYDPDWEDKLFEKQLDYDEMLFEKKKGKKAVDIKKLTNIR